MSVSERRLFANRRNALRSTGPRTAEGKARCAQNAVTHGIYAKRLRLRPGEMKYFQMLRLMVFRKLKPVGPEEQSLAERIAEAGWKLQSVPLLSHVPERAIRKLKQILRDSFNAIRHLQNQRQTQKMESEAVDRASTVQATSYEQILSAENGFAPPPRGAGELRVAQQRLHDVAGRCR